MNKFLARAGVVSALFAMALVAPALAQNPTIDYYGFAWEEGSFPPSNPGDVLEFCGVATFADAIFGVDLGSDELTFRIYGLVSTGAVDLGGYSYIVFAGGTLEIWRDGAQNADWGVTPPNPTTPSTFSDGSLFFQGSFNDFALFITSAGAGSYEGTLNGLGGEMIDSVCTGCAYSFGGAFTTDAGAQIPEGYDFQMDGVFDIEAAVAEETTQWGSVKALFRN